MEKILREKFYSSENLEGLEQCGMHVRGSERKPNPTLWGMLLQVVDRFQFLVDDALRQWGIRERCDFALAGLDDPT